MVAAPFDKMPIASKLLDVKHSWLSKNHENHESFPPRMFYCIRYNRAPQLCREYWRIAYLQRLVGKYLANLS